MDVEALSVSILGILYFVDLSKVELQLFLDFGLVCGAWLQTSFYEPNML